jgi:hypothetical protein
MRRADSPPATKSARTSPRFDIDRTWLLRGCLALAVIGFILVLAKVSMTLFGSGSKRLERHERASEQPIATRSVSPAKPPPR